MGSGWTLDIFRDKEAEARERDQQALQGQKHPEMQRQELGVRDGTEAWLWPERGMGSRVQITSGGCAPCRGADKAWGSQGGS